MLIEEALKDLSPEELVIHEKLKNTDEDVLFQYILKRDLYKEATKEEIDHINDIYEGGTTIFEANIFGKKHQFKLLVQKEKNEINQLIDKLFNTKDTEQKYYSEDQKNTAILSYRVLATVAASVLFINNELIADIVSKEGEPTLENKIKFFENITGSLIQTLYDKYTQFESRIYTLFQYESMRKK